MNFFYIFDTKVNSLQLILPKSNQKKYEQIVIKILKNQNLKEFKENKRFKQKIQNNQKIVGKKVENNLFIGCILEKKSKDREAHSFIKDIQEFIVMEKKIRKNKRVKEYVELQIDKYQRGGFKDGIAKTEESLRKATSKAKQNLLIAQQMQEEITGLDEEVKIVKDKAQTMQNDATVLQREAYIYNKKVTLLIYGFFTLMIILIGLYVTKIVL